MPSFAWCTVDHECTFVKTCKDLDAKSMLNKRLEKITWYLLLTYRVQKWLLAEIRKLSSKVNFCTGECGWWKKSVQWVEIILERADSQHFRVSCFARTNFSRSIRHVQEEDISTCWDFKKEPTPCYFRLTLSLWVIITVKVSFRVLLRVRKGNYLIVSVTLVTLSEI